MGRFGKTVTHMGVLECLAAIVDFHFFVVGIYLLVVIQSQLLDL